MRDKESGGMDKGLERHLDSDGQNRSGVESKLGRNYVLKGGGRRGHSRGKKSQRSSGGRRGR